jgi:putative transcriptional regulator
MFFVQHLSKILAMKEKNFNIPGYLQGSLLVATPLLKGSCFEKSVIDVCAHNETGAMGILVNHTLGNLKCGDILTQVGIKPSEITCDNSPVYFGGPVESAKGFILHTSDYFSKSTQILHDNISLTSTIDILEDIALGKGPSKRILALGCAGWAPGQIEKEVKENSWITIPANESIVFDTDNLEKWQIAANSLGINFTNYSLSVGNA